MVLRRVKETQTYQRIHAFTKKYERFFMPAMLVGGTATDVLQFKTLQISTTFLIMGIYAFLCAAATTVLVVPAAPQGRVHRILFVISPFVQQFTIGALLSTSLLFYWFSGSISVTWPIVGLVAILMVSNEVLRTFFMRISVQIGVFFFALFSLSATFAAYVFNSLSPFVFIAGGLASLLVMAGFLVVLMRVGNLYAARRRFWLIITGIFAAMHIAYFMNIIPPIPLSLRAAGMYYDVSREGGEYVLTSGDESWIARLLPGTTMRIAQGDPVYAFTAIFAPTDLSTTIVHRWEYYNVPTRDWVTASTLSFGMTGGRSEGYRGYSLKRQLTEGKWRVSVETERGQVLGRIPFTVEFIENGE